MAEESCKSNGIMSSTGSVLNSETVREVCDLIRIPRLDLFKTYDELADRILSAHGREMAAKDAAHQQWRENYHSQIAEKDAEIALLKAALKPVMECTIGYVHVPEMGLCKVDLYEAQRASFKAVQNAQGIMRHAEI